MIFEICSFKLTQLDAIGEARILGSLGNDGGILRVLLDGIESKQRFDGNLAVVLGQLVAHELVTTQVGIRKEEAKALHDVLDGLGFV